LSRASTVERVVIAERHGVRAPSSTPEALSGFSAEAWPAWPVPPGDLTPHGASALRLMGAWLRSTYAANGLFPASGCPPAGSVFVWADGRDQRTIESGDAVLSGLAPGCGLAASHGEAGRPDPIFDAVKTGACKLDAAAARRSVVSAMPGGLASPVPGYAASMATLRDLLDPPAARTSCAGGEGRCFEDGTNSLAVTDEGAKIKGPLATASTLTEALALEYDEGFTERQLGWGRLDQKTLGQVMMLHNGYTQLTRENPALAGHNGARLAQVLIAAIDGKPAFPNQPAPAKLSIVLGHDTTIANLAGMLGVRWTLPGQPDDTPPGGAIVFEIHSVPAGEDRPVKISMLYQTAGQLRHLSALDGNSPPGMVTLEPWCESAPMCTIKTLQDVLERAVPPDCKPD